MRKHFIVVIAVLVLASLFTACVMPDGQMVATDGSDTAAEVQTEAKDWPLAQDLRICHIIELGHPYSTAKVALAQRRPMSSVSNMMSTTRRGTYRTRFA